MILTMIFAALSAVATAGLFVGMETLSLWWLLPIWLGLFLAVGLLHLLLIVLVVLLTPKSRLSPRRLCRLHRWAKLTLRWALVLLGLRVVVKGEERLPEGTLLLVGNHRSAYDPICTFAMLQKELSFVAKPGVLSIPVLGPALSKIGMLAIDRENARNAVTTIKQAAEHIKEGGISMGIYPEGTRSKDDNLLPFHSGSFKIAKLAGCPIAVASVRVKPRRFLPPSSMEIRIVDVMDAAYVADNNTAALSKRTQKALEKDLGL